MPKLLFAIFGLVFSMIFAATYSTKHAFAAPRTELAGATINEIVVPYEVLLYAQLEYQGQAVTDAHKIVKNGEPAYRLKVDSDDDGSSDLKSINLFYDENWELLDQDEVTLLPRVTPRIEPTKPDSEDKKDLATDQTPADTSADRDNNPPATKPDPDAIKPEDPDEEDSDDEPDEPNQPPSQRPRRGNHS